MTPRPATAFSLLELLLVVGIIAILAALLLPAVTKTYARAKRAKCLNNLKQIGVGFHAFAHEHGDKLPMQVSTNAGGSMEFVTAAQAMGGNFFFAFRHLQVLSNDLSDPKMLICPADFRSIAESFAVLRNENISYFVVPAAEFGRSDSMLAGDRNIAGAWSGDTAVLRLGPDNLPGWTHELHDGQGNILFGDSHVELLNSQKLQTAALLTKKEIPLYLPLAAPDASVQAGSSHGADASAGPAIQSASAGGNQPGATASAGSASTTPVGGLDRLEMIFQDPKQGKSSLAQPVAALGQDRIAPKARASSERFSPESGALPIISESEPNGQTNRAAVTNGTRAQPESATATAGDPWALGIGQLVVRLGSRSAWWLLLLLLAGLVGIEVQRRRRARKKNTE